MQRIAEGDWALVVVAWGPDAHLINESEYDDTWFGEPKHAGKWVAVRGRRAWLSEIYRKDGPSFTPTRWRTTGNVDLRSVTFTDTRHDGVSVVWRLDNNPRLYSEEQTIATFDAMMPVR